MVVDIVEYKQTLADLNYLHMGPYFGAQGTKIYVNCDLWGSEQVWIEQKKIV